MTQIADKFADLREAIVNRLGDYPALNLHLVSAHCNGAGLGLTEAEALDQHAHEHRGPGTIRNHDPEDLFWDPTDIAVVLLECVEEYEEDPEAMAFELARLMQRPNVVEKMAAREHTHDEVRGDPWTVCPAGEGCRVYPRTYDARRETTPDGAFVRASSSPVVTSENEDIGRGLHAAQAALQAALSNVEGQRYENPALAHTLVSAQERLRHSAALLAGRIGDDER